MEGTYSDGQISLNVKFVSRYQADTDKNGKPQKWDYYQSEFVIRALDGNHLGEESFVIYRKKKHYFKGDKADKSGYYTKSKTLFIPHERGFSTGQCQLVYSIKDKSGRVRVIKRNLYLNAKNWDGKMEIRELKG